MSPEAKIQLLPLPACIRAGSAGPVNDCEGYVHIAALCYQEQAEQEIVILRKVKLKVETADLPYQICTRDQRLNPWPPKSLHTDGKTTRIKNSALSVSCASGL